eukprot:Em0014g908a
MQCPGTSECDKPDDGLQQTILECNMKTMVDVLKKALENIEKAQGRQKVYYDQIHCKDRELYEVGTLVLLKNSKKLTKKGSKMEPNWTGPYLIHEVLSKGTYRLSHPNPPFKVLAQKYNMTRLKIFYQRDQLQDSESESKSEAVDKEDSPIPPGNLSKDDPCKCQKRCATKRCPCKRKNQPCSSWCHAGRSCCNTSAITNCTTHLVITVSDEQPSVPNKKLLDVAVLDDPDGWLDDEHISAAQDLLQQQHPNVSDLQSSTLQYTRTFDVHKDKPFVQRLHENRNHWITVSTVGCSTGVVQVYDSSQHLKLSTSLKCIISDMLQSSNDSIVVQYIKMNNLGQVIVAFLLLQLLLQYAMVKMFVCLS